MESYTVRLHRPRSPALTRSLARSCAACHAHALKMLSLLICTSLSEHALMHRTVHSSDTQSWRSFSMVLKFSKAFEKKDLSLRHMAS